MPRRHRFFMLFLLVATFAATGSSATLNHANPAAVTKAHPPSHASASQQTPQSVYITDIAGKRVRLVGPRFMPDPGGHHLMIDGKPERIDQR